MSDNSSLSHLAAMTRPCWLRRAVRNRQRHAIEQASRRWRGTRRKILISTQTRTDPAAAARHRQAVALDTNAVGFGGGRQLDGALLLVGEVPAGAAVAATAPAGGREGRRRALYLEFSSGVNSDLSILYFAK